MAQKGIVWTEVAVKQRRHIFHFWNQNNGSTTFSEKLLISIASKTKELIEFPLLGKKSNFPETRVISMGNFSLFYQIIEDEIIISSFWDNRQNPEKLSKALEKADFGINYKFKKGKNKG